jgi:hypothetical protein
LFVHLAEISLSQVNPYEQSLLPPEQLPDRPPAIPLWHTLSPPQYKPDAQGVLVLLHVSPCPAPDGAQVPFTHESPDAQLLSPEHSVPIPSHLLSTVLHCSDEQSAGCVQVLPADSLPLQT